MIKELQLKAGWTQEQLAAESGLPQSHISRLEAGKHSPSRATLEKIAKALGVDVAVFDPSA
jgi:transcriptional regulator with XRE-family HTH domain